MGQLEINHESNIAKQRSDIYGLLAMTFRQEMTQNVLDQMKDPQFLGVLSDFGLESMKKLFDKPDDELLEELSVDYARLFLGPGKHIAPYESVHHEREDGDWGKLWGKSTVEVKKFIESTGLEYRDTYDSLPDHIAVEMEFMQEVTRREGEAWEKADKNSAVTCRKIEKKFLEDHLIRWVPNFCEKVMDGTDLPFYRNLAAFTNKFIQFEQKEIKR